MHSPNFWLVGPVMSLVLGVILIGQGLWRFARHNDNPVKERKLSKAKLFGVRAVLVSSGLFLTIISALLALGLMKR